MLHSSMGEGKDLHILYIFHFRIIFVQILHLLLLKKKNEKRQSKSWDEWKTRKGDSGKKQVVWRALGFGNMRLEGSENVYVSTIFEKKNEWLGENPKRAPWQDERLL